jgi:predicted nucleic acid-binding protein
VIIVSDTSPINNLAAINHLHLLHQLYETVFFIPEAVYQELTDPNFPVAGAIEVQTFDWIQTRAVSDCTLVEALSNELDIGEAEAIVLAVEIQADQVLIDERRGWLIASRLNLRYTSILGILVEAKNKGLIARVKPLLDALINEAGFWVAKPLYDSVLQLVNEIGLP